MAMFQRICWLTLLVLALPWPARSQGCSIPVFRYALERWAPSQYEVVVFHRAALPKPANDLLARFQEPGRATNVNVKIVDLGGQVEKPYQQLWQHNESKTLPWLVVRFPGTDEKTAPLWAGPLEEESISALVDSPIRQKVVQHLTQGDSAVFLLLTSRNKEADEAAETLLRRECSRLQEMVKLPEQSKEGPQLTFNLPLKVSFPLVVLSRTTMAERFLVQMLLRGDDDLTKITGPVVFPIFARGRLLCSFHGDTLTAEHLEQVGRFLCGACSCQVKEDNPGVDLLIACAWEDRLADASGLAAPRDAEMKPAPQLDESSLPPDSEFSSADSSLQKQEKTLPLHEKQPIHTWLVTAIVGAAILVLVTGFWALRKSEVRKTMDV